MPQANKEKEWNFGNILTIPKHVDPKCVFLHHRELCCYVAFRHAILPVAGVFVGQKGGANCVDKTTNLSYPHPAICSVICPIGCFFNTNCDSKQNLNNPRTWKVARKFLYENIDITSQHPASPQPPPTATPAVLGNRKLTHLSDSPNEKRGRPGTTAQSGHCRKPSSLW